MPTFSQSKADIRSAFGASVRALREQAGLSQRELSKRSGVRPQALSRLERGQVFPRLDTIFCITQALEVHPAEPFRRMAEALGLKPMSVEVDLDGVSRDLLQASEDLTQTGVPEKADGDADGLLPLSLPERVRWLIRRPHRVLIGLRLGADSDLVYDIAVENGAVTDDLRKAKTWSLKTAKGRRDSLMAQLPGVEVSILDLCGESLG